MPKSSMLRARDFREIVRISHECRDLGDSPAHWQTHFLSAVGRLVGADAGIGGELAGVASGIPRGNGLPLDWGLENGFNRAGWDRALENLQANPNYSMLVNRYLHRREHLGGRPVCREEIATEEEWSASRDHLEVHSVMGVGHFLFVLALAPDCTDEVFGGLVVRPPGRPDFGTREGAVVEEAMAVVRPMLGGPLARFVEPSPADLSPREREALRCLLEGDGAKQVAKRMGIGEDTANQYTKRVFRHFGVSGRAELLARWLRRGCGRRFAWAEA